MEFVYAIFWNDGAINLDTLPTCQQEKWVPILSVRSSTEPDVVRLITFKKESVAKKFSKLNLPKDWLQGTVKMCAPEMAWCKQQGWKILVWDKAVCITKRKDFTIEPAILEFQEAPAMYANRRCES